VRVVPSSRCSGWLPGLFLAGVLASLAVSCAGESKRPRSGTAPAGAAGASGPDAGSGGDPIAGSGGSAGEGGSAGAGSSAGMAQGGGGGSAGNVASAGRDATGGAVETAGQGGAGGSSSAAGSAGADANGNAHECETAADCTMTSDCCGCRSEPRNAPTTCPLKCARDACAEDGLTAGALGCVFGRCVFMRSCGTVSNCPKPPDPCPDGLLRTFWNSCSSTACLAPIDCIAVGSCESCGGAFCVETRGMSSSFSCVERVRACDSDNYCECLGVCGTCTKADDRVSCPCGGC
jgi:hypothetical protein